MFECLMDHVINILHGNHCLIPFKIIENIVNIDLYLNFSFIRLSISLVVIDPNVTK